MSPDANVLAADVERVLSSSLRPPSGVVYVVDPTPEIVEALVEFAVGAEAIPEIRVLAGRETLKTVMDDFIVASNAADLIASAALELRVTEKRAENALFVTESAVVAVVTAGDHVAGLVTDDEAFVQAAIESSRADFEDGERFRLRTPAISTIRDSLEDELGRDVRADFDAVLDSLRTVRSDGNELDEVAISLLVAAKNDILLYDVSKWGEDVGVASKATFSRTKSELEESGLIATEKVPIDVGRPRLRLKIDDERLAESPPEDLTAVALDILE